MTYTLRQRQQLSCEHQWAVHHRVDFVVTNDSRLRREISLWITRRSEPVSLQAAITAGDLAAGLVAESPDEVRVVVEAMSERDEIVESPSTPTIVRRSCAAGRCTPPKVPVARRCTNRCKIERWTSG